MKSLMLNRGFLSFIVILLLSFFTVLSAEEDTHYIQDDDYFISQEGFKSNYIYVHLSKMLTPPEAATKNEGEFLRISDGSEVWTKFFWKTRTGQRSDIKVGTQIICFDASDENGVYRAPEDKDEARTGSWFMARITDVSDLYKGHFKVSGGYSIKTDNIRIIVK